MLELFSGDYHRLIARQIFRWEEEITILRTLPGFTTQIGRNHRTGKQKLAHQWLHGLRVDFEAVYYYNLSLLKRTNEADWPNMPLILRRLKLTFYKKAVLLKICLLCRIPVKKQISGFCCSLVDAQTMKECESSEMAGIHYLQRDGSLMK